MTVDVLFPHMSEETDEGVLVTWFVEPGAHVDAGDLVAAVQVEKVEEEVYAPAAGDVVELRVAQGDVAHQGDVIARIGEAAAAGAAAAGPVAAGPAAAAAPASPVPASPAARRLARELGVDLGGVAGSGPGGRIVEDDVRAAAARHGGGPEAAATAAGEPLPGSRRIMADRLRTWMAATAQFTVTTEVDVTGLAEARTPFTAAVVRACAVALQRHPKVGSRWRDDRVVPPAAIDIGVAVALDDGLVVPVVRAADGKDIGTLAAEIADLAARAAEHRLAVGDMEGAVFTVTNLGGFPVDAFTPVLHPPQTAILGMGRARAKPAVVDGRVEVRTLMVLSLTVDHQVIDGTPAAAFLTDVATILTS